MSPSTVPNMYEYESAFAGVQPPPKAYEFDVQQ
jgi:hypothetical protein